VQNIINFRMDSSKDVKIPEDRVGVLIGKEGSVKKQIEKTFRAKIEINSDGLVLMTGKDSLDLYTCEKVIKAIGRGFNPEIALLLKNEDYDFELVNINDYTKSQNDFDRLRGRVIGKEGASRDLIEKKTQTYIVIYGKTVGIIGKLEMVEIAFNAVEMLLKGARHPTVFNYIDKELRKKVKGVIF
ncbi:MAG: KH domain-containing protein, partial [Patescibacteria group bacterium]|nr:KH domain-containing protein [Patescibacteria group bacterium]